MTSQNTKQAGFTMVEMMVTAGLLALFVFFSYDIITKMNQKSINLSSEQKNLLDTAIAYRVLNKELKKTYVSFSNMLSLTDEFRIRRRGAKYFFEYSQSGMENVLLTITLSKIKRAVVFLKTGLLGEGVRGASIAPFELLGVNFLRERLTSGGCDPNDINTNYNSNCESKEYSLERFKEAVEAAGWLQEEQLFLLYSPIWLTVTDRNLKKKIKTPAVLLQYTGGKFKKYGTPEISFDFSIPDILRRSSNDFYYGGTSFNPPNLWETFARQAAVIGGVRNLVYLLPVKKLTFILDNNGSQNKSAFTLFKCDDHRYKCNASDPSRVFVASNLEKIVFRRESLSDASISVDLVNVKAEF